MNAPTITRSLAVVATRADIVRASQALGGAGATSSIYLLLQQRITPPPAPDAVLPIRSPAWQIQAAGTHTECMARVVRQAVDVATGALRGPNGCATPEAFIAQQRVALDAAVSAPAMTGLRFRVGMLTHGVSERVHAHRAAHDSDPIVPLDRIVCLEEGLMAVLAVRYLGTVVALQGSPFSSLVGGEVLLDQMAALPRRVAVA